MAEGAEGGDIKGAFKKFASKAEGKEQTSSDFTKWCKDANVFGKACNSNHVDISFTKVKPKAAKTITFLELDALITEMAKKYKDDHKIDEDKAKEDIKEKLGNATPKLHGVTKTSKTGAVDKMTDASKYTGTHKERFDETGKGKGIAGREEIVDNTGYVGNYKGAGTYEEKQ